MGKGARSSIKRAEAFRDQQREAAEKQAGQKKTRIIAVLVTALLICGMAALTVRAFVRDSRNTSGYYMRNAVVMTGDKISLNAAEMSYFIYNKVNSFLSSYYNAYSAYYASVNDSFSSFLKVYTGLDTALSLKSQYHTGSQTWFDYFKDQAEEEVSGYIALYSKAVDSGMSLSDADLAGISARAATLDLTAYGTGVNRTDAENAMKLKTLADKYKYSVTDGIEISDDDLDAYYDEHLRDYSYIDYVSYTVTFGKDDSIAESDAQAKEFADKLAAATDKEQFLATITEIAGKKEAVDSAEVIKAPYSASTAMSEMFDKSAKELATYRNDNGGEDLATGSYTVYMLLKAPYKDETKTADVRHILIATYEDDDAGKAKAEDILKQIKDSGYSDKLFTDLAARYSEDLNSLAQGGMYKRVQKAGDASSVFDEWCFGTERTPGDCEVVKTSYGYHVMYFAGYGVGNSMASAYNDLQNERYADIEKTILEQYPSTVNAEAYDTIKA